MQFQTILVASVPRVDCSEHGIYQMKVPWAEPGSVFTAMFEALAIDWLKETSISGVGRMLNLSWREVDGIMARAVARGLERRKLKLPAQLGVDETSFQKRHEYVTLVSDLVEGEVLHVGDGRSKESLGAFYKQFTPEELATLDSIAMDMCGAYIAVTRELVPDAEEKIAFDKFHVAAHLSDAVDKVRRIENAGRRKEGDDTLKGTKYLWLTNPTNMSDAESAALDALVRVVKLTARAWAVKELAMELWDFTDREVAKIAWIRWYKRAIRSRLEPVKKVARMVKEHLEGILNAVTGITNAKAEGINATVQWVKATACGFRNRERFRNAIYFHLGGLDLYPHETSKRHQITRQLCLTLTAHGHKLPLPEDVMLSWTGSRWLSWRLAALLLVLADPAIADCLDGTTDSCVLPNGCGGERDCIAGNWSPCICAEGSLGSCTVCGRGGTMECSASCQPVGTCRAAEVCNGCDDDQDGVADDGLYKCATGPFTVLGCSSSAPPVPYVFRAHEQLPGDPNPDAYREPLTGIRGYSNNLDFSWKLYTNPTVSNLSLNYSRLTFEWDCDDRLEVVGHAEYCGMNPPGLRTYLLNGSGQQTGLVFRMKSDAATSSYGLSIIDARPQCSAGGSSAAPTIAPLERVEGLLLGTGDTLFFAIAGAAEDLIITLQGYRAPSTEPKSDFDLYVRAGALPERSVYTERSARTPPDTTRSNDEGVRIPGSSLGTTWFVAVTSHQGAGFFRLRVSRVRPLSYRTLTAGTNFDATSELPAIRRALNNAQRRVFGMTEGQQVIEWITLQNNNGCVCGGTECDICFVSSEGTNDDRSFCDPWFGRRYIEIKGRSRTNDLTIAHEIGHCLDTLDLDDEYGEHRNSAGEVCHTDHQCGHSIMALLDERQNNLCTPWDHKLDEAWHVAATCPNNNGSCDASFAVCRSGLNSQWSYLQASGWFADVPSRTPDNEPYIAFDGLDGVVFH